MAMGFEPAQEVRIGLVFRTKHGLHFVDQDRGPRLHIEQSGLHVFTTQPQGNLLLQHREFDPFEQREPVKVESIHKDVDTPTRPNPFEQPLRDRIVGLA